MVSFRFVMEIVRLTSIFVVVLHVSYAVNEPTKTLELLQAAISGGRPDNPGASLTVNKAGVNYAFDLAGQILNNEIMNLNINDIYEKFNDGFVNISNLRITAYNPPQFVREFEPLHRLTWGLKGVGLNVESYWKGSKKVVIQAQGEGTFHAKARQLDINVSVEISNTSDGRPVLRNVKCKSGFGKIELYIKGGLTGWLLNSFRKLLINAIKPTLENKICEIAENFVRTDMNKILATFPPKVKIVNGVDLQLALFNQPSLTLDTVATNHSGRVYSSASSSTPFDPRALNTALDSSTEKMVSLFVTDYIINALLYHIYASNYFHIEIDPGQFGRVSCSIIKGEICLGSIFADLSKFYPANSFVHILMNATSVPFVFFVENKTVLYGEGEIILKVFTFSEGKNQSTIFLNIRTLIEAEIRDANITNSTLYSSLNLTSLTMEVADGENIASDLWSAFVTFIRPLLQNILRNMLTKGWRLNLIDGVQFYDGRVQFYNRTMLIEADLDYYHELKPNFIMPDSACSAFVNILLLFLSCCILLLN